MAKAKDVIKDLFHTFKGIGLEKTATGAQSPFNINDFVSKLQERNSLARANRYVVRITPQSPEFWGMGDQEVMKDLVFFCDNVNVPGRVIAPAEIKRQTIGPFDRRPNIAITDDVQCSFMLDSNGLNFKFFYDWMQNIINMDASKGEQSSFNGATFGEIQYRNKYLCNMEIETYDVAANLIHTVKCAEVWPYTMSPVTYGWMQNDEFAKVQIAFYVRYFTLDNQEPPGPAEGRTLSSFEQLLRIGQSARALSSSFKTPNNVGDVINVVSNAQTFLKAIGGKT